ncbi:restriction endonuclease subunit S [Mycolicibacterium sp.]|uniref:restriction endonuclease subunit S n=1 Tax=Mycolicibacterium sp. TaxID=2320850 RepID=UPI0037C7769C
MNATVAGATFGEIMVKRGGSIDPSRFPDEEFDLYSIPAYDLGEPDVTAGHDIGSSKQIVEPGDVLLSRIVPHIRRAWVVGPNRGRRLIASGEWIVFRSDKIHPDWLRHYVLSDNFHRRFMQTVAGVGGSLLRARPAQVAGLSIEIPPLNEQRRTAAILDRADRLRVKQDEVVEHLKLLVGSVFHNSFSNEAWPSKRLDELAEVVDCPHSTPHWTDSGEVCIRTSNLVRGGWDWTDKRYVSQAEYSDRSQRGEALPGDIILSREGTVGVAAIVEDGMKLCMGQRLVRVRTLERLTPEYTLQFLLHALHPDRIGFAMVGSTARHLNVKDLRSLPIPVPPITLQKEFAYRVFLIHQLRKSKVRTSARLDELFASLQSRTFRGEL